MAGIQPFGRDRVIEELRLREFGVIDEAELELGPGLTVVTGETGAGKTMLLTGLSLLWGGRADSSVVRAGASKAMVEAHVSVAGSREVIERVEGAGGEVDVDESGTQRLIIGRTVAAGGGSKAYLGGRSVPAGVLADVGNSLFAVHGQDDQQRLVNPRHQRALLDAYAGPESLPILTRYREAYAALRDVDVALNRDESEERRRLQELDLLTFGIEEIDALSLQTAEDVSIAAEIDRLAHVESLQTAAAQAHEALRGDEVDESADALSLVVTARRRLDAVAEYDPRLAALVAQLDDVVVVLSDTTAAIAAYLDSTESDPARLDHLNQRRSDLARLTRKYGEDVDAVIAWREDAGKRIEDLQSADAELDRLAAKRSELIAVLTELAATLTGVRTKAAAAFESEVMVELRALSMPDATFRIDIRGSGPTDASFGPDGVDEVEFLLAAHPGMEPVTLSKGASGGERSRVMLAIEVVLAGADPVPTMVFDEVDAGVGGRAAVEVGRRLARLARTTQVLVVTHLPQVAAFGDQHIRVIKGGDGRVTRSSVTTLDPEERASELARMLAGLEDSDTARAHANELLDMAYAEKSSWTTSVLKSPLSKSPVSKTVSTPTAPKGSRRGRNVE